MSRGLYKEWITDDGLLMIESWARDGLTDKQISKNIGVSDRTFSTWKKNHASITAALKKGKRPIDMEVENALLKRARGFEYEETETWVEEVDGVQKKRVKRIKKYAPPDTSAAIFWLKNRKPEEWRRVNQALKDKTEAETQKILAEIDLTKAHTLQIEGETKDTTMLQMLLDSQEQYEKMAETGAFDKFGDSDE